jgi:hypothetical protein
MQFTAAVIASVAALASALPQTTPIQDGDRFGVITILSGSPIQNAALQASRRGIIVGANSQNATCDTPTNSATFYIVNQELFLHSTDAPYQSIFVDRSGMGKSTPH